MTSWTVTLHTRETHLRLRKHLEEWPQWGHQWLWNTKDQSTICWLWPWVSSCISDWDAPKAGSLSSLRVTVMKNEIQSKGCRWVSRAAAIPVSRHPTWAIPVSGHASCATPVSGHHTCLDCWQQKWVIHGCHPSRYLEIRTEGVEKRLACAVIVVTELEGMSCICPKYLLKGNRRVSYFQN